MYLTALKLIVLAAASPVLAQLFPMPELQYAFTASIYAQAIGTPIMLPGYNSTAAVFINSTISGPLLNATSVSIAGAEYNYGPSTGSNVTYSTSWGAGIYNTSDGQAFLCKQAGPSSNKVQSFTVDLSGIGGKYAYLRQYLIICASPHMPTYNFNASTPQAPSSSAHAASVDCYVVGGT